MDKILTALDYNAKFKNIIKDLTFEKAHVLVHQLNEPVDALLLAKIFEETNRNILYVAHNLFHAQKIIKRLGNILDDELISLYPVDEFFNVELLASSGEFKTMRLNTLTKTLNNEPRIYVTYVAGYTRPLIPKSIFKESFIKIKINEECKMEIFKQSLIELGYTAVTTVELQSHFSVRGGIIDVFPINSTNPIRIEFFGDEIDSIRLFSIDTQISINKINEVCIPPVYEVIMNASIKQDLIKYIESKYKNKIEKEQNEQVRNTFEETLLKEVSDFENYNNLNYYQRYIQKMYGKYESISDYIENPITIFNNYAQIKSNYNEIIESAVNTQIELLEHGKLFDSFDYLLSLEKLINKEAHMVYFEAHLPTNNIAIDSIFSLESKPTAQYFGNLDILLSDIRRWEKSQNIIFTVANDNERTKVRNFLLENGFEITEVETFKEAIFDKDDESNKTNIHILNSKIDMGFALNGYNAQVISFNDIYGVTTNKTGNIGFKQTFKDSVKLKSYDDLKIGDYLVHEAHGIGRYIGIENISTLGVKKDFIKIAYQGTDVLFVPIDKFDLVQKYIGKEGIRPKIHKLGSTTWIRQKNNVKSKVKDIADRLVKVYVEREQREGHSFDPDTSMQTEFESSFNFVETPDQLKAIEQVKQDMESKKPMDRLVCGDVGYGKTEVAIRAAFKAVMDSKQVAFLAPTTILTHQHYQTLLKRTEGFPIKIALLNRFVTLKRQREILAEIEKGYIDIIIGTHRLLSKDVIFKDLGLLIVDEEQRFGVLHKERIKEIKTNVDILTLTATPIPRTLQMSLVGIRGLSTINTPPKNRYPIQTYVTEENDNVIKNAIEREIARDGQVLYLYNFVEDIEEKANKIKKLVPEARVTFAHGQMKRVELEKTILDFVNAKYNVLVCTTIIETGMDIPAANTLIVSQADRLGLSQLYQIRGRVGRSDRIAYAYFTYKKDKVLSEIALKRLNTIRDFTELGSGFKIAMQDLSIRGAGDILGSEQSGFIDSVGFNMYNQLLKEAIEEAKENKDCVDEEKPEVVENEMTFSLKVDTYIPSWYIYDEGIKIDLYKRIRTISKINEYNDIDEEFKDRFGDYPKEVENLMIAYFVLNRAKKMNIKSIVEQNKFIEIIFSKEASEKVDGNLMFSGLEDIGKNIRIAYKKQRIHIYIDKVDARFTLQLKEIFVKIDQFLFLT